MTDSGPRDDVPQYALPLVIDVERETPPHRTDALEAAARAVLTLLTDPRVREPDGEWAGRVRAWATGRIRKVVRRARGAAWRRAQAIPGITLTHGTAQLRVYPPVPVDGWPPDLARLQVAGTELDDLQAPPDPPAGTAVLYLNPHLSMSAGKAMAQAGHAAQLAWLAADPGSRSRWEQSGFPLAVRTAAPARWGELAASGVPAVRDAGFTEVAPGSVTLMADLRPVITASPGTSSAISRPAQTRPPCASATGGRSPRALPPR